MEKEVDYGLYDRLLSIAFINSYTLANQNKGTLVFYNFDCKNKSHLCIYNTLKNTYGSIDNGTKVIFKGTIKNLIFKLKNSKGIKIKLNNKKEGMDINEFIGHIEKANNALGLFGKIYEEYYA